jgi:hypothetical protein
MCHNLSGAKLGIIFGITKHFYGFFHIFFYTYYIIWEHPGSLAAPGS